MAARVPDDFPVIADYLAQRAPSVPAATVARWTRATGASVDMLMRRMVPWAAATFSRPPISGFRVGALALAGSGALYFGGNLEFPGVGLANSIHAEQSAIQNALAAGERRLVALAVSAAPCGHCRQFLQEVDGAAALPVYVGGDDAVALGELLPRAFGPRDLGVAGSLLDARSHGLRLAQSLDDPLVAAALAAADSSYAPYTRGYAGMALRTGDGALFVGALAESAAYNPTLPPLAAALNQLALASRDFSSIRRAVLVELRDAPASQAPSAGALLAMLGVGLEVAHAETSGTGG